jgi:F-type H+-transporting ATPase subunit delta
MNRALARRYSRALADILFDAKLTSAKKAKAVQQTKEHLTTLAHLLESHAGLRNILTSPALPLTKKLAVIDALRKTLKWDQTLRNFVAILVENRRLGELDSMIESFDEEVYARLGIVPVEITSAVELKAPQKKELEKRLAGLTGSDVELRYQKDEDILGGVVARMGSTIYDGSLRAHLRRLEAQLAK